MTETQQMEDGLTMAMRWAARLLALIAVGLFVLFVVESGARVLPSLSWNKAQGIPMLLVLLATLVGLLIAWRWELAGGVVALVGAALITGLVCMGSGLDMFYCAFLFTLPLIVAGALYLGCCWRMRQAASAPEA